MSNTANIPFVIKTNGSVTLYLKSECMTVAQDHPNYNKIVDALKKGETNKIENLINVAKAVTSYGGGKVSVQNGQVFYAGVAVHNTLTERIIKMMAEGFKIDHMLLFLNNLMANPSFRAVNETYTFLENHGLPITDDGCFLAYKAVRSNLTDIRTGTFDNSVGCRPQMARNSVDENYEQDCSSGLHVGSLGYVVEFGHFRVGETVPVGGNRLLIVKVNPKDVVSVPRYAGHTKMRVCEYLVVEEIKDVVKELDKVSVYKADATPLDSDWSDEESSSEWENEGELSWNESYLEGYSVGESDRDNFNEYGENRDYNYSKGSAYLEGYNAGYNGRPSEVDATVRSCAANTAGCGSTVTAEDPDLAEYNEGYDLGMDDAEQGCSFQCSLDLDESDAFKDGYKDGYNDYLP